MDADKIKMTPELLALHNELADKVSDAPLSDEELTNLFLKAQETGWFNGLGAWQLVEPVLENVLAELKQRRATPALPLLQETLAAEVRAAAEKEIAAELGHRVDTPAHDQAVSLWLSAYRAGAASRVTTIEVTPTPELSKLAQAVRAATYCFPLQVREASTTELEIADVNGYSLCYFSGMETDQTLADFLVAAANAAALPLQYKQERPAQSASVLPPVSCAGADFSIRVLARGEESQDGPWFVGYCDLKTGMWFLGHDNQPVMPGVVEWQLLPAAATPVATVGSEPLGAWVKKPEGEGWISCKDEMPMPATHPSGHPNWTASMEVATQHETFHKPVIQKQLAAYSTHFRAWSGAEDCKTIDHVAFWRIPTPPTHAA